MSFADDLAGLRSGALSFARFCRMNRSRYEAWAGHYVSRWRPYGLDVEDLAQEAFLATWKAIERFDPDRGPSLQRFVEVQVGTHVRTECERSLGWPCKERKIEGNRILKAKRPVRPVPFSALATPTEDDSAEPLVPVVAEIHRFESKDSRITIEHDPESRMIAIEAIDQIEGDLRRTVATGILAGAPVKTIAASIYSDPTERERHSLSDLDTTIRLVRREARILTKTTSPT